MLLDKYGRDLDIGFTVVFTSTPHRGKRHTIRTGRIIKLHNSGRLTIKEHISNDVGKLPLQAAEPTGRLITLNSSKNCIQW